MAHHADLEPLVRSLIEKGRQPDAVTATIRGHGPEIRDFLYALHRNNPASADEVFSMWTEGVWRGIEGFAWDCGLRTWCYAIARYASLRHRRDDSRRTARHVPVPEIASLVDLADESRSSTPWYHRSAVRSRFAELRESLPPDDQLILLLRVDRGLAWNDIARVTLHDGDPTTESTRAQAHAHVSEQELTRVASRLRKHFQGVKERLYKLGREQGMLPVSDEQAGR